MLTLSPVAPTRDESFPAVLQERVRERGLNWSVTNAWISGDTTSGGRRRVPRRAQASP